MFICESCLEKNFNNWGMFQSYGKCEICDKPSSCFDTQSSRLERKVVVTDTVEELRNKEIHHIYKLLQTCLEEEGYVIPFNKYADGNYKAFDVELKNSKFGDMRDDLLVKIEWS